MSYRTRNFLLACHTLQTPAPEIGAIGLNSTPDSGAMFFMPLTSLTAFGTRRQSTTRWHEKLAPEEVVHRQQKLAPESGVAVMSPISGACVRGLRPNVIEPWSHFVFLFSTVLALLLELCLLPYNDVGFSITLIVAKNPAWLQLFRTNTPSLVKFVCVQETLNYYWVENYRWMNTRKRSSIGANGQRVSVLEL